RWRWLRWNQRGRNFDFFFRRRWRREFEPCIRAVNQREHRDGGGGLFLRFLDAGDFAVNFLADGFVAREQFLSARAHGLQNVMGVDLFQWTGRRVGGLEPGNFNYQMR